MSVYLNRRRLASTMPVDETFLIYGDSGSGKTFLSSTFPKTEERPLAYVNILEDGIGSAELGDKKMIEVVDLERFEEVDEFFTDVYNGYTVAEDGTKVPMLFSSIVIDSATNLEFLIKKYIKESSNKQQMSIQLWGQKLDTDETLYSLMKSLSRKLGIPIVIIAHTKKISDDDNPQFNKEIPSLQEKTARSLAAKTSFVWFTKVEFETSVVNGKAIKEVGHYTYINTHPYLLTKARKPASMELPQKIKNLSYETFKKNVLDKLNTKENE